MAKNSIEFKINESDLKALEQQYGQELTQKALRITSTYTMKLQRKATGMIRDAGHIDTGRLVNSITQKVGVKGGIIRRRFIQGEVNAGTKYARFIHEGAQHDGDKIVPHFVAFKVAPSLLIWAIREGVIYQKEVPENEENSEDEPEESKPKKRGRKPKKKKRKKKQWYFMSAKGKEFPIDIIDGGLPVKQEAVKYFEKPLEKLRPEYFEKLLKMI